MTSEQRDLFHVQTQTLGVKYLNIGAQEYLQLIYSDIFTCQKCLISGSFDILILYFRFYSGLMGLEFHHFRGGESSCKHCSEKEPGDAWYGEAERCTEIIIFQ